LYVFLKAAMPATCLCHLTLLNLILIGVLEGTDSWDNPVGVLYARVW
jgi:hypothetical protein